MPPSSEDLEAEIDAEIQAWYQAADEEAMTIASREVAPEKVKKFTTEDHQQHLRVPNDAESDSEDERERIRGFLQRDLDMGDIVSLSNITDDGNIREEDKNTQDQVNLGQAWEKERQGINRPKLNNPMEQTYFVDAKTEVSIELSETEDEPGHPAADSSMGMDSSTSFQVVPGDVSEAKAGASLASSFVTAGSASFEVVPKDDGASKSVPQPTTPPKSGSDAAASIPQPKTPPKTAPVSGTASATDPKAVVVPKVLPRKEPPVPKASTSQEPAAKKSASIPKATGMAQPYGPVPPGKRASGDVSAPGGTPKLPRRQTTRPRRLMEDRAAAKLTAATSVAEEMVWIDPEDMNIIPCASTHYGQYSSISRTLSFILRGHMLVRKGTGPNFNPLDRSFEYEDVLFHLHRMVRGVSDRAVPQVIRSTDRFQVKVAKPDLPDATWKGLPWKPVALRAYQVFELELQKQCKIAPLVRERYTLDEEFTAEKVDEGARPLFNRNPSTEAYDHLPRLMYHSCDRYHAREIIENGMIPGGWPRSSGRAHNYFVLTPPCDAAMQKLAGTRAGQPMYLGFDVEIMVQEGVRLFRTKEAVLSPDWIPSH